MEINKQLFEDVLLGRLKGTFVLFSGRDKDNISSSNLSRFKDKIYKYKLGSYLYNHNGIVCLPYPLCFDILKFIPTTV